MRLYFIESLQLSAGGFLVIKYFVCYNSFQPAESIRREMNTKEGHFVKPEQNKNSGNKPGDNRKGWFGMASIIFWALIFTILLRSLFSGLGDSPSREIEYSLFRDWVRQDIVERVLTQDSQFIITLKDGVTAKLEEDGTYTITVEEPSDQPAPTSEPTNPFLFPSAGNSGKSTYITAPPLIRDDRLIDLLEEHGVTYEAKITSMA